MNVSLRFIFLVCISKILTVCSQEPAASGQTGPGISSCNYFGSVDSNCNFPPVSVECLPQTCTSFFFDALVVSTTYDVYQLYSDNDNAFLDLLLKSGKPVYVSYGHESYQIWGFILACMTCNDQNAYDEVKGIQGFVKEHPGIKGLSITGLDPFIECAKEIVGFSDNLKKYLEVVKKETKLELALTFYADNFMDYYSNPKFPWLDFPSLDVAVDFYVVTFNYFRQNCTADLRHTGIVPLCGNAKYTLEKLKCAIEQSKIPKEKLYFFFQLRPRSNVYEEMNSCVINYQMLCQFPKDAIGWCSDTQETYFQKGQWAATNGAGFIGGNVDLDDPANCCSCGPYPSFNAILDGFNGCTEVHPCPAADRKV